MPFLDEVAQGPHRGIIVTAGNSATGSVAAALVRRHGVPAIFLVRFAAARDALFEHGIERVLVSTEDGFEASFGALATEIGAATVFDGVGGDLLSRILPHLPVNATVRVYGFLGGASPIAIPTMLLMGRNLTLRRFTVLKSSRHRSSPPGGGPGRDRAHHRRAVVPDPDWQGVPVGPDRSGHELPVGRRRACTTGFMT